MAESTRLTLKDRIISIVFALALGGLGAWMILYPDQQFAPQKGYSKGAGIIRFVEWIWSMPAGIVLILLSILLLIAALMKDPSADGDQESAKSPKLPE